MTLALLFILVSKFDWITCTVVAWDRSNNGIIICSGYAAADMCLLLRARSTATSRAAELQSSRGTLSTISDTCQHPAFGLLFCLQPTALYSQKALHYLLLPCSTNKHILSAAHRRSKAASLSLLTHAPFIKPFSTQDGLHGSG